MISAAQKIRQKLRQTRKRAIEIYFLIAAIAFFTAAVAFLVAGIYQLDTALIAISIVNAVLASIFVFRHKTG